MWSTAMRQNKSVILPSVLDKVGVDWRDDGGGSEGWLGEDGKERGGCQGGARLAPIQRWTKRSFAETRGGQTDMR